MNAVWHQRPDLFAHRADISESHGRLFNSCLIALLGGLGLRSAMGSITGTALLSPDLAGLHRQIPL
jgi:hypothetical protein